MDLHRSCARERKERDDERGRAVSEEKRKKARAGRLTSGVRAAEREGEGESMTDGP